MPINVLLTIIWLSASAPPEINYLYTNTMGYCKQLAAQIKGGDGADYAFCKYVRNH